VANFASTGGRVSTVLSGTGKLNGGMAGVKGRGRGGGEGRESTPRWSLQYLIIQSPNGPSDAIPVADASVLGVAAFPLGARRNVSGVGGATTGED